MIFYIKKLRIKYIWFWFLMCLQNISYKLCFSWIFFILSCLLIRYFFGWVSLMAHLSEVHLLCCCGHRPSLVILFSSAEYDMQNMSSACRVVKPPQGEFKGLLLWWHEEFYFLRLCMTCEIKYFHSLGY
jgi:hypothetical protein